MFVKPLPIKASIMFNLYFLTKMLETVLISAPVCKRTLMFASDLLFCDITQLHKARK